MTMRTLSALLVLAVTGAARADVTLASPFTDHAVLQRGKQTAIFGKAAPGEQVSVTLDAQTQSATAGPDGKWLVMLKDLAAGGPYTLGVQGKNAIKLQDVYVGEVWLASGQSNMDFTVAATPKYYFAGVQNEAQEVAAADHPTIRMFSGLWQRQYKPQERIDGQWKPVTPENVKEMSAVAYFYALNLQKELKVPVGILTETYGASCAESWISRESLAEVPLFKTWLDDFDAKAATFPEETREAHKALMRQFDIDVHKSASIQERVKEPARQGDIANDQHQPTVMFNGMIAPIIPYTIRGAIWYQGESITKGVNTYPQVQETLIKDWRRQWNNPDMPFYIVQLAALDSAKPDVREAQAKVLSVPHTGMAVTIDIGDHKNVHPKNKQDVGYRLSRIALADAYGQKVESSGPLFESMAVEGSKIRIRFTHIGGSLRVGRPGATAAALAEFTIAGEDGKYVPAEAVIEGESVVVSAAGVPMPKNVRYAWAGYPENPNLYNDAGLPAAPFRTER